jgi:phage FluMu protein Com
MMASSTVLASVTVTITAFVVVYTDVKCPDCGTVLLAVPGNPHETSVRAKLLAHTGERTGAGPVVKCRRCKWLVEVIASRLPPRRAA